MNIPVYLRLCATALLTAALPSCHQTDDILDLKLPVGEHTRQPSTLTGHDTLRILAIGNSFTEDPTEYLPLLAESAGIDAAQWCLYGACVSSSPLSFWYDAMTSDTTITCRISMGGIEMTAQGTLPQLLAQPWDVVTMQQVSSLSFAYESFRPYADSLACWVRRYCTNPDVLVAWQQTWAYDDTFEYPTRGQAMYEKIAAATEQFASDGIVDLIIPTGTAIQNARHTELNTPHGLTRDGAHLTRAAGFYVGACTWFETLFAPVFGMSVLGNTATRAVTDAERPYNTYETVDVTPENRELLQTCAVQAVLSPFATATDPDDNLTSL